MASDLAPHPRLFITREKLAALRTLKPAGVLKSADQIVAAKAEEYVRTIDVPYPRGGHNEHLIRARAAQGRVFTLLTRYFRTGETKYRDAAVAYCDLIGSWEYWSWITWRQNNADPLAIYDLSYGENSTTLAVAYDWLHDELTDEQKRRFHDIATRRSIQPFLKFTASDEPNKHAWWYLARGTNWNTVTTGGAGMLALAMDGDIPDTKTVIERTEKSFVPYMQSTFDVEGGWEEGIGYWNYGMRYAFMYLLSHENATGRKHPLMERDETRRSLTFPLDFSPNGVPCSFGDVNFWAPLPFHCLVAQRLGDTAVTGEVLARMAKSDLSRGDWPNAAEALVMVPAKPPRRPTPRRRVARIYKGLDWAVLADRMPQPNICAAIRGGTTKVHHGHRDLMSFHLVIGDEAMVPSPGVGEYLDTTFSPRRYELYDTVPMSKNTILINGVGVTADSTVATEAIRLSPRVHGFRIDATQAMGSMRDGSAALFCGRVFLMLNDRALLIVDRARLPHNGRMESRFHTRAEVVTRGLRADLAGQRQRLAVLFASNVPSVLAESVSTPTTPPKPPAKAPTVFRLCSQSLHTDFIHASLFIPGKPRGTLSVAGADGGVVVKINVAGLPKAVRLSDELR